MLDMDALSRRMDGALKTLASDFAGLRTGRASAELLDPVQVEAYGSMVPLKQVGSVTVPEPRMLAVQVWDKTMVKAVEKGIASAGLGLNPMADGQLVRIPLPELTEERRKELVKVAGKYAEQARVAVRNVRRDGMDQLKKMEKDKVISEDEHREQSDKVQKMTDDHIAKIDEMVSQKEKDILKV